MDLIRNARSQRAMRPASIVVAGPLAKGSPHVRCVQWDEIVQAFASYASNQPFAMSVGGGHTNRRSQYVDAPAFDRLIQTGRERLVSIVQKKLVVLIARKGFPQLLQSPLRSRMLGDIEVKQTSGSDLKGNEDIKDTDPIVTETKKSQATIPFAWFRMNVDQR